MAVASTSESPLLGPNGKLGTAANVYKRQPSHPIRPSTQCASSPSHFILDACEPRSVVGEYMGSSSWLGTNTMESSVGDRDVPTCASQLARARRSDSQHSTVEIKVQGGKEYKSIDRKHISHRADRVLKHQLSKLGINGSYAPKGGEFHLPVSDVRTLSATDRFTSPFESFANESVPTHLKSSLHNTGKLSAQTSPL